jgi:hypothetical protein
MPSKRRKPMDNSMNFAVYVSIALLSIAVPMAIFVGRNNVRSIRGQLVLDLANLFEFAKEERGTPLIVPSFELIKYKYDVTRDPIPMRSWIIPVIIYVILSFLGFLTAFGNLETLGIDKVHNLFLEVGKKDVNVAELVAALSFAFLGGYLWSIQYLIRRVANFDLSPLSFLRSALHVLFGSFVTAVAWHAAGSLGVKHVVVAASLVFLIGMYPTLMLDKLMARFSYLQLRRVSDATRSICEEVPLDTG